VTPAGSITPTPVANVSANDPAVHGYQQALHNAAPGTWSSGLHLGAEQVTWAAGTGALEPAVRLYLPLGGARTARQFFRGTIPTPLELENAIAAVEDEVHIAHRQLQGLLSPGQVWAPWSADASLQELATLAGVPPGPQQVLRLDAMERLFNRLAAVSEGRPAAQEGLPHDPVFAGTLLVLRELMHHLPFASLVLMDGTTEA
jgi:exopolyphosphatase/pppGpp-phosphohydrolase